MTAHAAPLPPPDAGSVPADLGTLKNLYLLDVSSNSISGWYCTNIVKKCPPGHRRVKLAAVAFSRRVAVLELPILVKFRYCELVNKIWNLPYATSSRINFYGVGYVFLAAVGAVCNPRCPTCASDYAPNIPIVVV